MWSSSSARVWTGSDTRPQPAAPRPGRWAARRAFCGTAPVDGHSAMVPCRLAAPGLPLRSCPTTCVTQTPQPRPQSSRKRKVKSSYTFKGLIIWSESFLPICRHGGWGGPWRHFISSCKISSHFDLDDNNKRWNGSNKRLEKEVVQIKRQTEEHLTTYEINCQ